MQFFILHRQWVAHRNSESNAPLEHFGTRHLMRSHLNTLKLFSAFVATFALAIAPTAGAQPPALETVVTVGKSAGANGVVIPGGGSTTVNVFNRSATFTPPAGYCVFGTAPNEVERYALIKAMTNGAGDLLYLAVHCGDIARYRSKEITSFADWYQVIALKRKDGSVSEVPVDLPEFVRKLSRNITASPADLDAILKRSQAAFKRNLNGELVGVSPLTQLGATSEAVMSEMIVSVKLDETITPIYGLIAITTVKRLALAVYAFRTPYASGPTSVDGLSGFVHTIVVQN